MPINPESRKLKINFFENLRKHGCVVRRVSGSGEIYTVNSKRINIRCTTKHKTDKFSSRLFWYSYDFSLNDRLDYVIFIMTNEDYFIFMDIEFLNENLEYLYVVKRKNSIRTFSIDWDNLELVCRNKRINIAKYHASLSEDDKDLPVKIFK
jgi:hypothetical protein